jgi:predicted TIM-barrel fold metal-dependent hydrolase
MIRPARALLSGYEVREEWLALGREEAIEPELAIIDPHHHLWERHGERYLFPDLLADLNDGHDVRASVFVQCRAMYRAGGADEMKPLGEVEFVNGIAAQAASGGYGRRLACAGIVAGADLTLGERVTPVLERMRAAAGPRLAGLRNSVAWHESPDVRSSQILPPKGLMADARFRAGVRQLHKHGLTLDVWCYQTQLGELLDLVRANPDTTIVIDHLGGPLACGPYAGKRDEMFTPWRAALADLAKEPNTRLKLGGLGMKVGGFAFPYRPQPPTSQELAEAWRPYMETGIALFGARRCMFESNFPVCKGMFSARAFWNACKRIAAGASRDEKAALLAGTAIDVYRLPGQDILDAGV